MGDKFIPNGDLAFRTMAECFARTVATDPPRFAVSQADSEALSAAVATFGSAHQATLFGGAGSKSATLAKKEARVEAERIIRRLAHLIRHSAGVDATAKMVLKLRERPAKAKQQKCPAQPPRLRFVRALHEGNGATPMHELRFETLDTLKGSKPAGAVRIELFADLIPPDEKIPARPGSNLGGRPWYLRSFTKNPIIIAPPMARVPMRVVYWARWADSLGNVGPFSATAVAWIEGGSHLALPGGGFGNRKPAPLLEDANDSGPAERDSTYSVAVRDAQYEYLNQQDAAPPLPAPQEGETRQLEGPAAAEAA